jgi:hypothetical protein
MFVGHFGLGLAGKAAAPRVSLGTWFLAVQLVDLLWPIFLLAGWEHVRIVPGITRLTPLDFYDYPITHSLVGALGWAVAFACVYAAVAARSGPAAAAAKAGSVGRMSTGATAALLGAGVFSHWLLDLLVHRPDLPVLPRGPYLGLGLWNLPAIEMALEGALFLGGAGLYLHRTRPLDGAGRYGTWLLLAALGATWLAAILGPPPPNVRTIAWMALCVWLFVLWAWWCDRHRVPAGGPIRT